MGRPLKKVNFGDTAVDGTQIEVSGFVTGGSAKTGYIVAQKGARRYKVTTADGTEVLTLVTTVPVAGEMRITATDSAAGTYFIKKLDAHMATLVKDTGTEFADGARVQWTFDPAVLDTTVQIANA